MRALANRTEQSRSRNNPFFSKNKESSNSPFFVQTKLTIGQPGDKYEREADAMADQVVNHTNFGQVESRSTSPKLQAKCSQCEEENSVLPKLQMKEKRDYPEGFVDDEDQMYQLPIQMKGDLNEIIQKKEREIFSKTINKVIQKDEEEEAPIDNRRDINFDPNIGFDELGGNLNWAKGRFSGAISGGLRNPWGALGLFNQDPAETFLDFSFLDDCNSFFQSLNLGVSHQQREDGRLFSASRNRTSYSLGAEFRLGPISINPNIGRDVGGGLDPSWNFGLSVTGGANTAIPDDCKKKLKRLPPVYQRVILPPPYWNILDPSITTNIINLPSPTPTVRPITIHFFYDSTIWRPDSQEKIHQLTNLLKYSPSTRVILTGHTSLEGREAYNQGLSERRANAVKDWLVMGEIEESRIQVQGVGESTPTTLEPNLPASLDTETEGIRTQNRRVEAFIYDLEGNFMPDLTLGSNEGLFERRNLGTLFRHGIANPGDGN